MGKVINDIVKMDWDSKGWLQTSAKRGKGVFIFASKDYDSTNHGKVTVFFTARAAFIFASDAGTDTEELWNAKELMDFVKGNGYEEDFPYAYDEYVPVIDEGDMECDAEVLATYGIEAYKSDIEARLDDVTPFGKEEDLQL